MNERIRELAVQAGFYVLSDDKIYIPTTSEEITDCQTKFAELIVQECAEVVISEGKKIADSMPQTNHDNYLDVAVMVGRVDSAVNYAASLKEHFGVE